MRISIGGFTCDPTQAEVNNSIIFLVYHNRELWWDAHFTNRQFACRTREEFRRSLIESTELNLSFPTLRLESRAVHIDELRRQKLDKLTERGYE